MDKIERHSLLKTLVKENVIASQEELITLLQQRECDVTQATLSRDLKELGIVKMHGRNGGYYYSLVNTVESILGHDFSSSLSGIKSIEFSGQLCVIKTRPGYANMVGSIIDSAISGIIMGTIAGDDTLLLLLHLNTNANDILSYLEATLPGISGKIINSRL